LRTESACVANGCTWVDGGCPNLSEEAAEAGLDALDAKEEPIGTLVPGDGGRE
jgi:hypothetical protein